MYNYLIVLCINDLYIQLTKERALMKAQELAKDVYDLVSLTKILCIVYYFKFFTIQ